MCQCNQTISAMFYGWTPVLEKLLEMRWFYITHNYDYVASIDHALRQWLFFSVITSDTQTV